MIYFRLEKGNKQSGFKEIQTFQATEMFEEVFKEMKRQNISSKVVRQWQEAQYTYIDYGNYTDFFRYSIVDI